MLEGFEFKQVIDNNKLFLVGTHKEDIWELIFKWDEINEEFYFIGENRFKGGKLVYSLEDMKQINKELNEKYKHMLSNLGG